MWLQHYSGLILVSVYTYTVLLSVLSSSDSQTNVCVECVAGSYANQSDSVCSQCDIGFCNEEKDCTLCLPGYNQSRNGTNRCQGCPIGTFTNETGSVDCALCEKGYYNNVTTQPKCFPCPVGCNSSEEGAITCKPCPLGTFANLTGSITCTPCAKGSYGDMKQAKNCTECSPGTYADKEGMLRCHNCDSGTVCNDTGCDVCTECEAGFAASADGRLCDMCAVGRYSKARSTECLPCDTGLICNHTGCSECWPCPPGEQPKSSTSCEKCPAGTYRPQVTTMLICAQCKKGYFQVNTGAFECDECPEGFYCPDTSSYPQKCPEDAHCPNGTAEPIFCHNLFTYSKRKKGCIPHSTFYIMVACVTAFALMVIFLFVCVLHRNVCSHKKRVEDKVALLPRGPVKNPTYTGL